MNAKEKAKELVEKYLNIVGRHYADCIYYAKQCALISVEREYNSLRELLFNLRACGVIENEKTYLLRLDELIKEEQEVKQEIEKL